MDNENTNSVASSDTTYHFQLPRDISIAKGEIYGYRYGRIASFFKRIFDNAPALIVLIVIVPVIAIFSLWHRHKKLHPIFKVIITILCIAYACIRFLLFYGG